MKTTVYRMILWNDSAALPTDQVPCASSCRSRSTHSPRARLLQIGTVLLLIAMTVPSAAAQGIGRVDQIETNIGAYHFYTEPGATTVEVHVIGGVRSPGLYEVSEGTDLWKVVSLSGGPSVVSRQRRDQYEITLRLYRMQSGARTIIYEDMLEAAIENPAAYPLVQEGDVVAVEVVERRRVGVRQVLDVFRTVAILGLAIERFTRIL